MHPYETAATAPDRMALICADTGARLTYGELDAQSNQAAQLFRALGLRKGDVVAILAKNGPVFAVVYWACQRSGLMLTPVSTHLRGDEVAYILRDCGAKALVTSPDASEAAAEVAEARASLAPGLVAVYTTGAALTGAESWSEALAKQPATSVPDPTAGYYLVYSGGSTGRPKGVVLPFESGPIEQLAPMEAMSIARAEPTDGPSVAMTPAPLYHAAPLFTMITTHRKGDTLVILERFDAVQALKAIETFKVATIQVVPTMFVRLLALPEAERKAYDLSSLRRVTHAAAPCPVSVKRKMIDWLGPIIYEYYSGSEANGQCTISPEEWLQKPGSVGRATWGVLHICDEAGRELPAGEAGLVYFEGAQAFTYRNDPEKTSKSRHPQHATWSTLGDIGYVDEDGYLFLCDRKDFMIISGGVNIYPQAVEDVLIDHPKVFDAAVIGVPNEAFGEEVKAVVQTLDWSEAGKELEAELIAHCRKHVSKLSCPRSIDFVQTLPRLPTGKLAKHEIRRPYWPQGRAIASDAG